MIGFSGIYVVAIGAVGGMVPALTYPSLSRLVSTSMASNGIWIPHNVMLWDDDVPILWDDDVYIIFDGGS